jgi:hypothetical protein
MRLCVIVLGAVLMWSAAASALPPPASSAPSASTAARPVDGVVESVIVPYARDSFALYCPAPPSIPRAHVLLVPDEAASAEETKELARTLAAAGDAVVVLPAHDRGANGIHAFRGGPLTDPTRPLPCASWPGDSVIVGVGSGALQVAAFVADQCQQKAPPRLRLVLVDAGLRAREVPRSSCSWAPLARALFVQWRSPDGDLIRELRKGEFASSETELMVLPPGGTLSGAVASVQPYIDGDDAAFRAWAARERRAGRLTYDARSGSGPESLGFNLSAVLGTAGRSDPSALGGWAFALGFRPELTLPRSARSVGIGPYLELGAARGFYAGGGALALFPFLENLAMSPSLGVSSWNVADRTTVAGVGGLFLGSKTLNGISYFDACYGLRLDVRMGLAEPRPWSLALQFQFDLMMIAAVLQ